MKIAIFDPTNLHYSYLYTQFKVFENEKIDFFISDNLYNKIKNNTGINNKRFHVYHKHRNEKMKDYYEKVLNHINNNYYDFIFFNSLQQNWILNFLFFLKIKEKKEIILSIHNINSFFKVPISYNPKHYLAKLVRKLALKKSKIYNVYGNNLKSHLLKYSNDKTITTIPFSFYKGNDFKNDLNIEDNFIKLVIPGKIDLRRRDYEAVYKIANKFKNEKLKIILLGAPFNSKSEEFLKRIKKNKNIVFFEEYISQDKFDKIISTSDIIFAPTLKKFKMHGIVEKYGISKETGATFLAIENGLPLIIPDKIKPLYKYEEATITYSNIQDLYNIISKFLNNSKQLYDKKKIALQLAKEYFFPDSIYIDFLNQINLKDKRIKK